jgi:hypothetical protein
MPTDGTHGHSAGDIYRNLAFNYSKDLTENSLFWELVLMCNKMYFVSGKPPYNITACPGIIHKVYFSVAHILVLKCTDLIRVPARSKKYVCGRSFAGIAGSNPADGIDFSLLWLLFVIRYRRYLCDETIPRREPYRMCAIEYNWVKFLNITSEFCLLQVCECLTGKYMLHVVYCHDYDLFVRHTSLHWCSILGIASIHSKFYVFLRYFL